MAAKKVTARSVTASDEVRELVDRGSEVDTQMKNLAFEDKGIKTKLGDAATGEMGEGELSIRLEGNKAAALVSVSEKYELDANAQEFDQTEAAIRQGTFGDAVKVERTLAVPPDDVGRAAAVLSQAGFANVAIKTEYMVSPEEFRILSASVQSDPVAARAVERLKRSVVRKTSTRISYSVK